MSIEQEKFFNKDGSITIGGLNFDNPISSPLRKFDFKEYKDGVKTTIREFWIERYVYEDGGIKGGIHLGEIDRHPLSITNRGVCRLDGKQLSGEDVDKVKFLFENIKVE